MLTLPSHCEKKKQLYGKHLYEAIIYLPGIIKTFTQRICDDTRFYEVD